MSPSPNAMSTNANEILADENYFLWEFGARMKLAKKGLHGHLEMKPENAMAAASDQWKSDDLKALAIIVSLLGPVYQSMIRNARSAAEAWIILREFHVRRSLHNRVSLRKQLHEFVMVPGDKIMDHLLKFDDLCLRLSAVGDEIKDDERLVILLGSLTAEYDAIVKIIEARGNMDLYEVKEVLRREYETLQKREKQEAAFKASVTSNGQGRVRRGGNHGRRNKGGQNSKKRGHDQGEKSKFAGRCYECGEVGHKRAQCPSKKKESEPFVFSVSNDIDPMRMWLLDSGASSHMTFRREDFDEFRPIPGGLNVLVASGQRLPVCGTGSVRLMLENEQSVVVTDVLYIPGLDRRLLSISALTAKGADVHFSEGTCTILHNGRMIASGRRVGKLYVLNVATVAHPVAEEANAADAGLADLAVWHARLGHVAFDRVAAMDRVAVGVPPLPPSSSDGPCDGCMYRKMSVAKYARTSGSTVKSSGLLDLIHGDLMGPMRVKSKGGARFVLVLVDDWSRYTTVYLLKVKSETFTKFKEYKAFMEAHLGRRIKIFRTDNGGEFCSKKFDTFCSTNSILHQTSAPYSPQQNGLVERANRSLAESARASLHYQAVDEDFWGEAIMTAAYCLNRLPNTARDDTTPFEVMWGRKPDVEHMRAFGSHGFVYVDESKRKKFDAKAHRCIFLGYADGSKAYRVWNLETGRIVVTRTIALDERPRSGLIPASSIEPVQLQWTVNDDDDVVAASAPAETNAEMEVEDMDNLDQPMEVPLPPSPPATAAPTTNIVARNTSQSVPNTSTQPMGAARGAPALPHPAPQVLPALENLRPIMRRDPPRIAQEGENAMVFGGQFAAIRPQMATVARPTQAPLALPPPPPGEDRLVHWSGQAQTSAAATTSYSDDDEPDPKRLRLIDGYEIALAVMEIPTTYREAMASPQADEWKEAVRRELRSHFRNHTWEAVRRPDGVRLVGTKWVFDVKRDGDGNIVRYKARLVAQGFRQVYGVDYWETYAPVSSLNSVRAFLALCCQRDYVIRQLDVETAFLNGPLDEDVFMRPPEGIHLPDGMICKLRRSIYGLKQAAAVWHKTIVNVLKSMGFVACLSDPCVFVRRTDDHTVYLLLYVDDLLIGCPSSIEAESIKSDLAKHFTLKDLGDARYVLGIEMDYDREAGTLHLCQSQFIARLVQKFGQETAYATKNPNVYGQRLHEFNDGERVESKRFRELIGSLLYIASGTRPDICVSICELSQYLEMPTQAHMKAAVRVLRYLKGTSKVGICYQRGDLAVFVPTVFVDANWGGDATTRRSTSGVLVLMAGASVVYKSKRQRTVALSSAESEYMALSLAAQETLWLRHLLEELGFRNLPATTIKMDNKAAIAMAERVGYQSRAKHIDLRYHFVRDAVNDGVLRLEYVPSAEQQADFMTKALPTPQFAKLVRSAGIVDDSPVSQ